MLKRFYHLLTLAFTKWTGDLFIPFKTQYLTSQDKAVKLPNCSPDKLTIQMQCKGSIDISMRCSLTGPSIGLEKAIRVMQRKK